MSVFGWHAITTTCNRSGAANTKGMAKVGSLTAEQYHGPGGVEGKLKWCGDSGERGGQDPKTNVEAKL
jgi:hypothetical protein